MRTPRTSRLQELRRGRRQQLPLDRPPSASTRQRRARRAPLAGARGEWRGTSGDILSLKHAGSGGAPGDLTVPEYAAAAGAPLAGVRWPPQESRVSAWASSDESQCGGCLPSEVRFVLLHSSSDSCEQRGDTRAPRSQPRPASPRRSRSSPSSEVHGKRTARDAWGRCSPVVSLFGSLTWRPSCSSSFSPPDEPKCHCVRPWSHVFLQDQCVRPSSHVFLQDSMTRTSSLYYSTTSFYHSDDRFL